jgi:hypothetical protein
MRHVARSAIAPELTIVDQDDAMKELTLGARRPHVSCIHSFDRIFVIDD